MADDLVTIADFVAGALDVEQTEVSDVVNDAPFVGALMISDTSTGEITHKYRKYTQEPDVGFRSANDGREYDHSVDEVVEVVCKILDFSWKADFAEANAHPRGPEYFIALEGARHLAAALFKLEKQIFYGTSALGAAAGFSGFVNNTFLDAIADDMVINAGGSGANSQASVYAVRVGRDDVKLVTPHSHGVTLGDTQIIESTGASGKFPAYYTPASVYVGLQMGGKYSIARLANLSGANNLTDDRLSDLRTLFPAGRKPQHFIANGTQIKHLQQSRTATNATGVPAPFPTEAFNTNILETDALVNTEPVLA